MVIGSDTKAVLLTAGLIFLAALLLGVWKYRQMATSEDALAHPYVDTAHRAALLYSFATLLLATFVELSGFSTASTWSPPSSRSSSSSARSSATRSTGWRRDTDNQFRDPVPGTHAFMWALIIGEIGGVVVLLAGFVDGQL